MTAHNGVDFSENEPEIYAAGWHRDVHLFDDPGDRRLWMDEIIKRGADPTDFELWEY